MLEFNAPRKIKVFMKGFTRDQDVRVSTINYNGENYIRLRDMENIAPIKVSWDNLNKRVIVHITGGFEPTVPIISSCDGEVLHYDRDNL